MDQHGAGLHVGKIDGLASERFKREERQLPAGPRLQGRIRRLNAVLREEARK